jgi:uncharacterized SAM-binding protein YcdF (DUF218 family)
VSRRASRPRWALLLFLVLACLLALCARLYVWPAEDSAALVRADAIVVLNGPDPRWAVAQQLARRRAAPVMLLSVPSVRWACPAWHYPGVRIVCFQPNPVDTRGEARFAANQAKAFGWRSLIVVSSRPQDTRARIRVERCFDGRVSVVTASPSALQWPYQVAYEFGATLKAELWQRGC